MKKDHVKQSEKGNVPTTLKHDLNKKTRLTKALRANLNKRKIQARTRKKKEKK